MVEKVLDNRELSARLMALEERVGRLETAVLKGYVAHVEKARSVKGPKASKAQEATCPECGEICGRSKDLIKEWEATPKGFKRYPGVIRVWIHYWQCPACGHKFRTATRIWLKSPKTELEKIEAEAAREREAKQAKTMGKTKLDKIRKKLVQRQTQGTTR